MVGFRHRELQLDRVGALDQAEQLGQLWARQRGRLGRCLGHSGLLYRLTKHPHGTATPNLRGEAGHRHHPNLMRSRRSPVLWDLHWRATVIDCESARARALERRRADEGEGRSGVPSWSQTLRRIHGPIPPAESGVTSIVEPVGLRLLDHDTGTSRATDEEGPGNALPALRAVGPGFDADRAPGADVAQIAL